MKKVLLYQPYFDRKGHFKYYYNIFFEKLEENNFEIFGVKGVLSDKNNSTKREKLFKFNNKIKFFRILSNFKGFVEIKELLENNKIHIIQLLDIEINLLAIFLFLNRNSFKDKKIIITQHSANFPKIFLKNPLVYLYRKLTKVAFFYIENNFNIKIITNGTFIYEQMRKYYKLKDSSLVRSFWGTNLEPKNKIVKKKNSFLFLGILRKDKNLEYVLKNFSKMKEEYRLTIAGYPQEYTKKEIEKLVIKYNIPEKKIKLKLEFLSNRKMKELLRKNKFILIPYKKTNLSNSGPLILGIQFECVPIVSNYGERGSIVSSYNFGYTFNFEKSSEFTNVLKKTMKNENYDRYLNNIRKNKNKFLWKNIINDLIYKKGIYNDK